MSVEIIALILLYTPTIRNTLPTAWDQELKVRVKPIKVCGQQDTGCGDDLKNIVKASLVVTPSTLVQQWKDEFTTRAPKLKVLVYEGRSKLLLPQTEQHSHAHVGETRVQESTLIPFNQLGEMAVDAWHGAAQEYDVIITTCRFLSQPSSR